MTTARRPWSTLFLSLVLAAGAQAGADELHLSDGRIIEGEVVSPATAEVIDIRVAAGGLVAIQHVPRARVQRVVYGVSARQTALGELNQQIAALDKRADASPAQWWTLAQRLQDRGESAAAKELAGRVLALDRHHPEARQLLGMARSHGVWMRPNEAAIARGEVFFRGAWVGWATQEQTLADEARRREDLALQRKERDERRQARLAAAAASESVGMTYPETYVGGYYRSPYYNPYGGGWYGGGIRPYYPIVRPFCAPGGFGSTGSGGGFGWHIGAAGLGSNTAWAFNWNGATGGGYRVR